MMTPNGHPMTNLSTMFGCAMLGLGFGCQMLGATRELATWPPMEPQARLWQPAGDSCVQQSPPDFSWPAVRNAESYELEVLAQGQAHTLRREMVTRNFHNFSEVFPAGQYSWRVRYRLAGEWSDWSTARAFEIDAAAWPFPVPSADALLARVPLTHPRVWVNEFTIAAFRARANGPRRAWFTKLIQRVRADMAKPFPAEPVFPFPAGHPRTPEWLEAQLRLRAAGWDGEDGAALRVLRTALAYLVTQDHTLGRNAVDQMLNLATWNPAGATSYDTHDQVHRALAWHSAVAYDWCQELMTPVERAKILEMIRVRTATIVEHVVERSPVNETPFDSHAWTVFGHVGIISIAMRGEIPEAEQWFRAVWPAYISVLPPWGGEDGGWSQGLNYWQYSQASIRMASDALLSSTGFSLYDKAYYRNHAYFPLYFFPHGTPRSYFGDGNDYRPGLYNKGHYARLAQIYQDPILRWAELVLGGRTFESGLEDSKDGEFTAYYSGAEELPATPPSVLPRARWLRDIGWVALHSDLEDAERVSFYFKSSPYGSHSHSHGDQNSFVLYAYGEALAIDAGYYDAYGTPHDVGFTRQTKAHNAVTHAGGIGQPIFNLGAKGRITSFVTHAAIDLTSGDATAAYDGAAAGGPLEKWIEDVRARQRRETSLSRAERHVIYLRPDRFVVIDDLAAASGREETFEWWLQALRPIQLEGGGRAALVRQPKADLRVGFAAPERLRAIPEDQFIGPPNAYASGEAPHPFAPLPQKYGGDPDSAPQYRVAFQTEPTRETRFIAVLQPVRSGASVADWRTVRHADCTEIHFDDGAQVFIAHDAARGAEVDGLQFRGLAAVRQGSARALHRGTWLEDANCSVRAAEPISVVVDDGRAEFFCSAAGWVEMAIPAGTEVSASARGAVPPAVSSHAGRARITAPAGNLSVLFAAGRVQH